MRLQPARPFVLALAAALVAALPAAAQSRQTPPPTGDEPPAEDLFSPVGTAFDMTPEQEKAMAAYRADPSAGEIQVLRINTNVPRTADAVNFNFLPGVQMMLSTKARQDRAPGDYAWIGGDDAGGQSATLVVKGDAITGTIRDGGRLFRVRPLGGGVHAVIEVDQANLPPEHPPAFDEQKGKKEPPPQYRRLAARPEAAAHPESTARAATLRATRAPASADAPAAGGEAVPASTSPFAADVADAADPCATIDVLVAYTPAAEAQSGGIDALVDLAILETNTSYANSGIVPRLRLVHVAPTSYVESGSMETDVDRLADPSDGHLDDIPPLRDQHHADLAVLVTGNGDFCGIASDILVDESRAYAVVGQNCATGYYSFGHEVGHLQGARHDPAADPTPTFAHGFFSLSNRKRTVMSYNCPPGCTRVDVWSSPASLVEGVTMGNASDHDNVRMLNERACEIAAFRQAPPGPGPVTPTPVPTPLAPESSPQPAPAASTWSLLALLAAAPLALRRPARA